MPKTLPKPLEKFFWDVDTSTLDPSQKAKFVIGRLLDKGDVEAASWVLQNYPQDDIKQVFTTMRDVSPKTANFWSMYLNIPKDKVVCLQTPYLRMRRSHWPY